MKAFTRELLRKFLRDLPWLLGLWLLVIVAPAAWFTISGEMSIREAAAAAVTFLPMVVPLSPVIWLRYSSPARRNPESLQAVAWSLGWFVVTSPLAILLGIRLADLLGLD